MKILIINGPNLNMLGKREELIYGKETLDSIMDELVEQFPKLELDIHQSNSEGEIIDLLHKSLEGRYQGVVINAGAYSHYSIAILDALKMIQFAKIEVHISNIYAREPYRKHSIISEACHAVIAGFGKQSYRLALQWFTYNEREQIGFKAR